MTTLQMTRNQLLARIPSAFDKVGGDSCNFQTPGEVRILFNVGDRQRYLSIPILSRGQRKALSTIGENYRVQLTYGEQDGASFWRFGLYDAEATPELPSLVCLITYLNDPRFGIERKIKVGENIDGPQPFDTLGRFYRDLLEFFKLISVIED
jgi:hypothetical protein